MKSPQVADVFRDLAELADSESVPDSLTLVGSAIGLFALYLERDYSIDRNSSLKMIQRHAHSAIKEMERVEKDE